ncbi:hypothetical protein CBS101457_002450 [Exobasidium rhododendri]|nr:hypothetical protein CBS101457_002450 [Exobasidium rhododendri]
MPPTLSSRKRGHSSLSHLFLLIILISFILAAKSASGGEEVQKRKKALSFSRRGLENANRLSTGQRPKDGSDSSLIEDLRPQSTRDLVLSDIVLVSSVEGGIYGLERSSGKTLWTLAARIKREPKDGRGSEDGAQINSTTFGGASPSGFSPLIGTSYGPDRRSFSDLANNLPLLNSTIADTKTNGEIATGHEALEALQELGLYVVEPSAGHVYVVTTSSDSQGTPRTSLSKLPLTLPQLVDLSPFSFPGDNSRVFVGHKSTSLVELDIQSGRIGAVFGGGQDAGVWCDSPPEDSKVDEECGHDQQGGGEWAYIGRTDYTLTIHLRGRPTLSQTLKFSTFAPNTADRDISTIWVEAGMSTDNRLLMGMPDEGTVVCFDAKSDGARKKGQDNTLWISDLGATVAGIFDIVYSAPHLSRRPPRPMIVPHPNLPLGALFPSSPLTPIRPGSSDSAAGTSLQTQEHTTLLGIADGHLYAMGGQQYPLISFSPRAPASQKSTGDQMKHEHHHPSCSSFGCLLGTYDLQFAEGDRVHKEGLYGFEVGHAPLLGIGDGKADRDGSEVVSSVPPASSPGQVVTPIASISPETKQSVSGRGWSSVWSWNPSPMMMMIQIVALLLLAILCGLVYVGAQELQRQRSEDAKIIAKEIVWLPRITDVKVEEEEESEEVKSEEQAAIGKPLAVSPSRDPEEVARELVLEEEAAALKTEKKKPAKRRKRGKRAGAVVQQREAKKDGSSKADDESGEEEGGEEDNDRISPSNTIAELPLLPNGWNEPATAAEEQAIKMAAITPMSAEGGSKIPSSNGHGPVTARGGQSLLISEEVLGYGSSGTIVFKGTFQGRAVAVKRLLRDFVDVASKEVSLLESADNHANVIRYFYKEVTSTFLFIALELCPASLADVIERPMEYQELSAILDPKKALFQIASGLQHLHSLSIVHRDIKPQNILVSHSSGGRLKMLLSDFGLSKRLDGMAQTSFSQTMNNPGGTVGWRAPEILRGDVSLDLGDENSTTSSSTNTTKDGTGLLEVEKKRLTRAVDIFALGCLTYYVLSNGEHPFGSRYEREMNIIRRQVDLQRLDGLGEEGHEAQHLVLGMIQFDAKDRPSATKVLSHPYFWSSSRRLSFLQDASDRFDIMDKDPPSPALVALEEDAATVVGTDWHRKIDRQFMDDLGKRRKYDCKSVVDLLRAIRNKKHHIHDLPPNLRRLFGSLPDGFLTYFTSRFPRLFLHTYEVIDSFAVLKSEAMFAPYFVPVSDES